MAAFSAFSSICTGFSCGKDHLGRYAVSLAGHDAGKIYLVIGVAEGGGGASKPVLLLADGHARKASAPKRKKAMHVRLLSAKDEALADKLARGSGVTDAELVHSIKCFKAANAGR